MIYVWGTLAPRISAINGPALTGLVSWAHQSPDEHDGPSSLEWEFLENGQWFEVGVAGPIIANSKEFCLQAALDGGCPRVLISRFAGSFQQSTGQSRPAEPTGICDDHLGFKRQRPNLL